MKRLSINIIVSAKRSGATYPLLFVELFCVLVEKKALVYGEAQEIAEVISYNFWRKMGRKDGLKSVKGSIGNITVR